MPVSQPPGVTEAAFNDHSARHQNGGADEIDATGLDGAGGGSVPQISVSGSPNTDLLVFTGGGPILLLADDGLAAVELDDAGVAEISALHTPGSFPSSGIRLRVGDDGLVLRVTEQNSTTIRMHTASGGYDIELCDTNGGADVWRHRDNGGVTRDFATMESRKGSGTSTITTGNTSVTVTHGAGYTPAAQDIMVTPTNSPTNDPGHFWVDTIGATTFTINVRADPGASGASFAWRVDR